MAVSKMADDIMRKLQDSVTPDGQYVMTSAFTVESRAWKKETTYLSCKSCKRRVAAVRNKRMTCASHVMSKHQEMLYEKTNCGYVVDNHNMSRLVQFGVGYVHHLSEEDRQETLAQLLCITLRLTPYVNYNVVNMQTMHN